MRAWRQTLYLLRSLFRRGDMDNELREELRYHVERDTEERVRLGARQADAVHEAHMDFGDLTRVREETTDSRGLRWLDDLVADVRHATRLIRRNPGFSAITIFVAAFGIGATTLVFSAVNGVLLRPLPFVNPDALVMLTFRGLDRTPSLPDPQLYAMLQRPAMPFAAVGGYSLASGVISDAGEPQNVRIERLTPSLVSTLGVPAAIGRVFSERDSGAGESVALLGHAFWRQHFGGDSNVVGRTIRLDDAAYVIIGVMPPTFRGPLLRNTELFLPLSLYPPPVVGGRPLRPSIVVRLADGVSVAAAQTWAATNLRAPGVQMFTGEAVTLTPQLYPLEEIVAGDVKRPLIVLLVAAGFVLALVVANVATLLLARASAREREMALRRALGAGRARQLRQVLTETLVLTGLGGILGVVVARFGLAAFRRAGVDILPRLNEITLDWRVLAAAAALTVACGLVAGLLPALAASQGSLAQSIKPAIASRFRPGRGWGGMRGAFVVVEVALSVVLLVGAGLLIKGFLRVAPSAPGFAIDHRLALSVQIRDGGTYEDESKPGRWLFAQDVVRRMRGIPGVLDVAVTSSIPLVRTTAVRDVKPASRPGEPERVVVRSNERAVSSNYFDVLQVPIVAGRSLAETDVAGSDPVAVVNQTAAARWWPGDVPIGRYFSFGVGRGSAARTMRVVGVARDARFEGTDTKTRVEFFVPYAQAPASSQNFLVRTAGEPLALAQILKQQVWAADPKLPVDEVASLAAIADGSVKEARFYSMFMAGFAAVALAIAGAGMFGVLSYMVTQRRREIGIRMALGAPSRSVSALVLRQGAVIAGVGLVAGAIAARLLTRFLSSLLLEVSPTDARVFAAAAGGLAVIALVASMAPVRRALSVDPTQSLRSD
jgi:putative ABC transport system permease protein